MLQRGDLMLVDEAGMLDQDAARALLAIADERGARVALIGDRHQLPAVGRGGVLDLAARWVAAESCLTLDTVHRFVRTDTAADGTPVTVIDEDYARLSLAMRDAADPAGVFDVLIHRGQVQVYASDAERIRALAGAALDANQAGAGNGAVVILADTREQVAAFNDAVRERLVEAGIVDDNNTTNTDAGQPIGRGDRVATRRNDTEIGVANRDVWTVTAVTRDGTLTVRGDLGERVLPAHYVRAHVELPRRSLSLDPRTGLERKRGVKPAAQPAG